jgi:restriction system protein
MDEQDGASHPKLDYLHAVNVASATDASRPLGGSDRRLCTSGRIAARAPSPRLEGTTPTADDVTMNIFVAAATAKTHHFLGPALTAALKGALTMWPLLLLVGAVVLGKLVLAIYRQRRLARSGIAEVDRMDGRTFEAFLGTVFRRLGYAVEATRAHGDYGADLVVSRNATKTAVQAKRWSKPVGVKAIQEVVAAKGYYGCDDALVVTNRGFTRPARQLAHANKVQLWDRDVLVERMLATKGCPKD